MSEPSLDLRYPGGKGLNGLAEWIVGLLPPALFYCEPFAGKGGVFRNKPPALRSCLNDLDPAIADWWNRQRLPGTTATTGDGIRILEIAADWKLRNLLFYIDPPYMPETRTRKRCYTHELTRADHVRILKAIVRLECPAAISGYRSQLYDQWLWMWRREEREVTTRGGVPRTECLWMNYEPEVSPLLALEYRKLGKDYRERERINKRRRRWRRRFEELSDAEGRALLLEMIDAAHKRRRTNGPT